MSAREEPDSPRVTARRRREAADEFRLMADSAPVMIWVADPEGQAVYFNRPWLQFTGRPLEAELGLGWTEGLHIDDRARTLEAYLGAIRRREPFELEYRLARHDGEARWLLAKGVPVTRAGDVQGFVGSCLDISDRRRAEEAARKREHDFKALAENLPDVIARLDRGLRCVYVNRAVEQAFGRRPEDLIGRGAGELQLPAHIAEPIGAAARRALATGSDQRFEFRAMARGETRHFAGRVIAEADGVLLILYDVTARAREEEKRAELLARERNARVHAESATMARDHFLSIVSHELRTPLNGIKTWAHFLDHQLRDAEPTIRRAVAGVMIGVDQQAALIDDLLDLTRALSGRLGLVKHPVALLPLLADAVEAIRPAAIEHDIAIHCEYRLGAVEVHGDADRIRQIFSNLLGNAVKFTPPHGDIWIEATADDSMARVEVRDNGAGIAPDFLPNVFDPFRQADQGATRRVQQGVGLGLALVQRLAELHGGHVTCESAGVDHGSAFRVYLPLRRDTGARPALTPTHVAPGDLPSLEGIGVLLIDDQREARESLAALLTQSGATVRAAGSAREALSILESSAATDIPEVLVCDIAMPDEDGYTALRRIRAWESAQPAERARRRPAVAISAYGEREDRLRALAEGFQMHLSKPISPAELMLVISHAARTPIA
jgi:PAS domain S-box-containing protein